MLPLFCPDNHLSNAIKYHVSTFCKHYFKYPDNSSSVKVGITIIVILQTSNLKLKQFK